jgi:hypothetical protein
MLQNSSTELCASQCPGVSAHWHWPHLHQQYTCRQGVVVFPPARSSGVHQQPSPSPGYPRPGAVQDHFANLLFIIRCGDVQGSGTNAIPAGPVLLGRSRLSNRNCRVITSVSCLNPGCFQQLAGQVMLNHVFSLLFPIRQ